MSSSGRLKEETRGRDHSTASPYLTCSKGSSGDNKEDRKKKVSLDLDE